MTQPVKDSFLDLERHRQLLEDNIAKLRKSLQQWQTWEVEYEGLKEEILAADPAPDCNQLIAIGSQYEGDFVTKKEIDDILGSTTPRSVAQVVNILDRRIDYVVQNVCTIQKQIDAAENRLVAATVISTPDVRNEEGLPLTDIIEELDEEGNIISSHTTTPGSAKPQLLEVLQKAGVKDLSTQDLQTTERAPSKEDVKSREDAPARAKKGVTFADDTKAGPEHEKSQTAKRIEGIMKLARQSESPSEPPVIPTNESAEDAALRREMLQYGMSEVGAVVAELDIEEGSEWSDEDYDDADATSSDDEDVFGRSTSSVVDDELRQRMIELEERLGARVMENIGKKASDYDIVQEGIGRVTINGQDKLEGTAQTLAEDKKFVRFSEDLDVAPAAKIRRASTSSAPKPSIPAPVSDIVERNAPADAPQPKPAKKASRFKAARSSVLVADDPRASTAAWGPSSAVPLYPAKPPGPKPFSTPIIFSTADERTRVVPTGPKGKTLAATIVERDVPLDSEVAEPDEFDANLLNQEVATEYHRLRNRMIQRQGGFTQEEESEIVPLAEEEGGPKKMSRFKAARLSRS